MISAHVSHISHLDSLPVPGPVHSPQWTPSDERVIERVKKTGSLVGEKSYVDEAHHAKMDQEAAILLGNTAGLTPEERKRKNGESWSLSESLRYVVLLVLFQNCNIISHTACTVCIAFYSKCLRIRFDVLTSLRFFPALLLFFTAVPLCPLALVDIKRLSRFTVIWPWWSGSSLATRSGFKVTRVRPSQRAREV